MFSRIDPKKAIIESDSQELLAAVLARKVLQSAQWRKDEKGNYYADIVYPNDPIVTHKAISRAINAILNYCQRESEPIITDDHGDEPVSNSISVGSYTKAMLETYLQHVNDLRPLNGNGWVAREETKPIGTAPEIRTV